MLSIPFSICLYNPFFVCRPNKDAIFLCHSMVAIGKALLRGPCGLKNIAVADLRALKSNGTGDVR